MAALTFGQTVWLIFCLLFAGWCVAIRLWTIRR